MVNLDPGLWWSRGAGSLKKNDRTFNMTLTLKGGFIKRPKIPKKCQVYVRPKFPRCTKEVSIGAFLNFYLVFAPLEYIPTIPPLSSYVINICSKKEKDLRYLKKDGKEVFSP